MKEILIAFDVDGTLIASGYDKIVHVMYSAYAACYQTQFRRFLHLDDLPGEQLRIMDTHLDNGGAPRFAQLSAIVNTLVNGRKEVVQPQALTTDAALLAEYDTVKQKFNDLYSALNDAAAEHYWQLFPSTMPVLRHLAEIYDLSIASGITQDILEDDLKRHDFDFSLFIEVRGADERGGTNKADILKDLQSRGYRDILFVGDSAKDQEYAAQAGVKFFRAWRDEDFPRLLAALQTALPDETQPWTYTDADKEFFARKTLHLMGQLVADKPLSPEQATHWIHQ